MPDFARLKHYIRDVPDFPAPGILFRDITPLLSDAEAFRYAIDGLAAWVRERRPDAIVAIESRGFLFGAPLADRLGVPFVPVRKPGKLPAARMSIEVTLEYGTNQLDIHEDALRHGQQVVVIDDLLATGGTAAGAAKLVELLGARVAGLAFVIELAGLAGRERLAGYDVHALLRYD
ncbi:MAG TPA: adenine phosphoribosyltransferase [Dehalococcoidia bacterium]|nr:adenine phosphoribosyltransferase [Dehalococcoidia bacterium]